MFPFIEYLIQIWCLIAPALFIVPSTFLTSIGFFSFLALVMSAMEGSMNRPSVPQLTNACMSADFVPLRASVLINNFLFEIEVTVTDRYTGGGGTILGILFPASATTEMRHFFKNPACQKSSVPPVSCYSIFR